MHKNPSVTKKSLRFFAIVACATFCYQWIPGFIFPLLSSLPLLCYFGHGQWKAYLMGSGYCKYGLELVPAHVGHIASSHFISFIQEAADI